NFIKRVVAGPGDKIAIRDGHVILNGKRQKESFAEPCGGGEGCDLPREITVPADHYFMMGDNRGSSDDSRFWGPVPRKWIIGEAFATSWPPKRIGLLSPDEAPGTSAAFLRQPVVPLRPRARSPVRRGRRRGR